MMTMTEEKEKNLLEVVAVAKVGDEIQRGGSMKTEMIMIVGKINPKDVMMTTRTMVEKLDPVVVVVIVEKVEEVKLRDVV
jgi:hypothetical protein